MSEEYIKKEDAIKAFEKSLLGKYILWDMQDKIKKDMQERISRLPTYSIPDSSEFKGDLISRQAVEKLVWEYLRKETDENIAFYEHFLELPSIENKGGWIPIEKREPEVHKYVMFTTKTTRREIGYKAKEEPYYFLFGDSGAYVKSDYILPWMELPEPYKGE